MSNRAMDSSTLVIFVIIKLNFNAYQCTQSTKIMHLSNLLKRKENEMCNIKLQGVNPIAAKDMCLHMRKFRISRKPIYKERAD